MSKLLEIFGRAITVDTAELIWHWLNALKIKDGDADETTNTELDEIIELIGNMQLEKALEKTKFYIFENPDCARGRMAAAAICLHQNQIKQAIEQRMSDKSPSTTSSNLDDLEKLAALRDRGIINEEEFTAKKQQLLGL